MIFVVFTVLLLYAKGQFVQFSSFITFTLGLQIPHCQDEEGNNVDLFELTCTPHSESSTHQMSITIKESCRKSNFLGIDFAHSFIWGDQVKILDFELRNSKSSNFWDLKFCPVDPSYSEFQTIRTMNDPTVNSPIGVRPDYSDVQCDDVMPRVGIDSEGPGLK